MKICFDYIIMAVQGIIELKVWTKPLKFLSFQGLFFFLIPVYDPIKYLRLNILLLKIDKYSVEKTRLHLNRMITSKGQKGIMYLRMWYAEKDITSFIYLNRAKYVTWI